MKKILIGLLGLLLLIPQTARATDYIVWSASSANNYTFSVDPDLGSSDTTISSQNAVKSYGDAHFAPVNGYLVTTRDVPALTNATNLGLLSTGLLKITVNGGIATVSIAVDGSDYLSDYTSLAAYYQPLDADLTYLASFTPSANVKTILNAANNAAIKTALGYYTSGDAISGTFTGGLTGNASTASALFANGSNCNAGYAPLGVDASGAVESCWQVTPAAIGAQAALTYPVTGVASPTAGYLTKWGASGNAIVDGLGLGTLTDTKYCIYTAGVGLVCNSTITGGGNVSNSGTPSVHQWPVWTDATTIKGVTVTGSKVTCSTSDGEPVACTNLADSTYALPNANTTGSAGSLKSTGSTGVITITGPTTGSTRVKTVRDANDTILELGGDYTPTGQWIWTSAGTTTWPTFNQDTTGSAGKLKSPASTGVITVTGPSTGTTRVKTVRDANDTILELGGSYTPTGTFTNLTMVTPTLGVATATTINSSVVGWVQTTGTFTAAPASTSTLTMTSDLTATWLVGMPVKYKISATYYYGQITAMASNLLTVAGAPFSGNVLELYLGDIKKVTEMVVIIPGTYEDASNTALISSDLKSALTWYKTASYLVRYTARSKTHDSTTHGQASVRLNGAEVNSSAGGLTIAADDTAYSTIVDINTTNYGIGYGQAIEITAVKNGAGDASDLTVHMVFVTP